jgi:hypothetical protein
MVEHRDRGLRKWGKSPFAMDIIRHLPYIDYKGQLDRMFIGFRASVVDDTIRKSHDSPFIDAERYWLKTLKAMSEFKGEIPPTTTTKHIIQITKPKYFHEEALYLDTFSGLVYRYVPQRHPEGVVAQEYCNARIETFTNLDEMFVPGMPPVELSRWGEEAAKNKRYDAEEMERQGEPQVVNQGPDPWARDDAVWVRHLHRKFGWPRQDLEKVACLDEIRMFLSRW